MSKPSTGVLTRFLKLSQWHNRIQRWIHPPTVAWSYHLHQPTNAFQALQCVTITHSDSEEVTAHNPNTELTSKTPSSCQHYSMSYMRNGLDSLSTVSSLRVPPAWTESKWSFHLQILTFIKLPLSRALKVWLGPEETSLNAPPPPPARC